MKIAVCVKQVPEGTKRIDRATMRLDRSGEGALNAFDAHAVEEALRVKDAAGDGEVVLVSMGPAKAADALRKALAMGADRSVLVTDDAAAGADLVGTSRVLAAVLEREQADLVLFGQQAARRRRRRAVVGRRRATASPGDLAGRRAHRRRRQGARQAADRVRLRRDRGAAAGGVAVSDAINEPRYPSLKGIMGAKSKPQETLTLADLGVEAGAKTEVLALSDPPPRGDTTKIEDDGSAAAQIVDFLAEKRLL